MRTIAFATAFFGFAHAISQGIPPRCDITAGGLYVNFGCQTFGLKSGAISRLNCTETSPGIMPWTLRPMPYCSTAPCPAMNGLSSSSSQPSPYTLRSGDGTSDPTTYKPGQLNVLYLRVLEYDMKYRGVLGYARPTGLGGENMRVGSWEQPDPDMFDAPWLPGNACQGGLTHASARIKPYLVKLYWRAPPAGTGQVKFEFLLKQGDANTGAFFYPRVQLMLQEAPFVPNPGIVLGSAGLSCTDACRLNGGTCEPTLQNTLATGSFDALVGPWISCGHMFSTCDTSDPLRLAISNDCTFVDSTCPPPPTSGCDAIPNPTSGARICNCQADPCNPSPCAAGNCTVDLTKTVGGVLTEDAWKCVCPPGLGGDRCQTTQAFCGPTPANFPCQNGGSCSVVGGTATCDCSTSFTGAYTGLTCEIEPPCTINPCTVRDANAQCINKDVGGNRTFVADCKCSVGFSGPLCMTIDGCAIRNSNSATQCMNGGICVDNPDDTDLVDTSSCNCMPPAAWLSGKGSICDQDVNECTGGANPCQNGGICVNLPGSYMCNCTGTGFGGPTCSVDTGTVVVDWCNPTSPCVHALSCINCVRSALTAPCTDADFKPGDISGYHCNCEFGWSGANCLTQTNFCANDLCSIAGQATGTCISNALAYPVKGYDCQCSAGWSKDSNGHCTVNIPDCPTPNPCANGGTCVDGINKWSCGCQSDWTGPTCLERVVAATDVPCPLGDIQCPPNSKCNGAGQLARCDVIGCTTNEACPINYECTGKDIPNSAQLYCVESSPRNPTADSALLAVPFL